MHKYSADCMGQAGLTLLEVMVTVVILSLGLLGLAGLQMTGLKNNRNAYYQTVAAQGAQDISEQLRVDAATRAAVVGNNYRVINASAAQCASDVAATFDSRVACVIASLPGGQAVISELTNKPKSFYVAIRWTDLELPEEGHGWRDTDANAVAACDTPTTASNTKVNCYYSVVRP